MNDLFWAVVLFGTGILVMLAIIVVHLSNTFYKVNQMKHDIQYIYSDIKDIYHMLDRMDTNIADIYFKSSDTSTYAENIYKRVSHMDEEVSRYTHTR